MTSNNQRQLVLFLLTGGVAAVVNFLSRIGFSVLMRFEMAIIASYGLGMITAYVLMRRFVFIRSVLTMRRSFAAFTLVNVFSVMRVWIVSVGLRNWLLPLMGIVEFRDIIAHGTGVMVPAISSYFGHKHISFREAR